MSFSNSIQVETRANRILADMLADVKWVQEGIENSDLKSIAEMYVDWNELHTTYDDKTELYKNIATHLDAQAEEYLNTRAIEQAIQELTEEADDALAEQQAWAKEMRA
jgi:hypothetical protein